MAGAKDRRTLLVEQYIASFAKLDDMYAVDSLDPIAWQLSIGEADQYGNKHWRPREVPSDPSLLEPLYAKLPARFPPLFERLILSYRWAEVDLQEYRLLPNPPGPDLSGLLKEMAKDTYMGNVLLKSGYIQFGKGPDGDYDPVCFEIKSRKKGGDYKIVKIDHEEILCNDRIKVVSELAITFEDLVLDTIKRSELPATT